MTTEEILIYGAYLKIPNSRLSPWNRVLFHADSAYEVLGKKLSVDI